jgi:hypothetical protein
MLLCAGMLHGGEVTSAGSGDWTDPATWRGGKIPAADDDVFIRKFDVVSFNRSGDDQPACRKLQIDPKGILQFKAGSGRAVCIVTDAIDCYGVIKIDGTKNAKDQFELRLAGPTPAQRALKLAKGAGLLVYGHAAPGEGKRNVGVSAVFGKDEKEPPAALIDLIGQGSVDLQRAWLADVKILAQKIDNTGAKPNERINVLDCMFTGQARVSCRGCDTPIVSRNSFDYGGTKELPEPAIDIQSSPLAEVKDNVIRGFYHTGIAVTATNEAALVGNAIEKCSFGVRGSGASLTLQKLSIRDAVTGVKFEGGSGLVEDVAIDKCFRGIQAEICKCQITNLVVKNVDPKGAAVGADGANLDLLNCDLSAEQLKVSPLTAVMAKTAPALPVRSQSYVIVKVIGAPDGSLVDVRTNDPKLAADVADPNVRNSPAPLEQGLTPLPLSLNPLIVRGWSFDQRGVLTASPEYTIRVLGPAAKEGDERPLLKMQTFTPPASAYRSTPNDAAPTVEVKVK